MKTGRAFPRLSRGRAGALVAAVPGMAIGAFGLAAWALQRAAPDAAPPMAPLTALAFLCAGGALALLALAPYAGRARRGAAGALSGAAALVGLPPPATALSMLCIGAAVLLAATNLRTAAGFAQWLAAVPLLGAFQALIGVVLGGAAGVGGMGALASAAFLALGTGALLAQPAGPLRMAWRQTHAGALFRRLVAGVLILLAAGPVLTVLMPGTNPAGSDIVRVLLAATALAGAGWLAQLLDAAEQEQRATAARLDMLAAASLDFAQAGSDYAQLIQQIPQTIASQLGDACCLLLLSDDRARLEPAALHGTSAELHARLRAMLGSISLAAEPTSLSVRVLERGEPALAQAPPAQPGGGQTMICLPVRVYGRARGVLNVYRLRPGQPGFSSDEFVLAQELVTRAALALESAERFGAEQRERISAEQVSAGLERLHAVTTSLSGALSVAEVATIIMTQGVDALGADAGLVALLDEAAGELQIIDARGYEASVLETQLRIALAQPSALTAAVQTGAPIWISTLTQQTREYPNLLVLPLSAAFQARAALPLRSGERRIGVLQLNFRTARTFESAERTVLEALAAAGAQALDRARVYDELQRSFQRLRALRAIDQAMLAGAGADAIIGRALDDLRALVPYAYAAVVFFPEAGQPQIIVERDWRAPERGAELEPLALARVAELFAQPSARYIPELAQAMPPSPLRDELAGQELRGLLTLPLSADGERIGQLNLFTALPRKLQEEHMQIVTEISSQIAIVLCQRQLISARNLAEERFRLVVGASPSGLIMVALDGLIVLANAESEHMFGYLPCELIGQSIDVLVPPRLRQAHGGLRQLFHQNPEARAMGAGRDLHGLRKDGQEFPIEIGLTPIQTSQGLHILSTIVDITERKRSENVLRQSEERFAIAFRSNPAALAIVRQADGRYIDANEAYQQLSGYQRGDLLGQTAYELQLVPASGAGPALLRQMEAGVSISNAEMLLQRRDGELRTVLFSAEPIVLGSDAAALITGIDITERKQAENALRESQQKLSALVDLLPVGVSILNEQHKVVYTNLVLEQIIEMPLGLMRDGIYQQRRYIHADGTPMRAEEFASSQALREQRAVYNVETGIVKENGAVTWVSVNAAPADFPDWRVVIVTSDITERKRSEAALREREEQLRLLTETMPAVPWSATPEGTIDYFTQRWLDLTGLSYADMLHDGWLNIVHPDDLPAMSAAWRHSLATGAPYDVVHRIRTADGSYRWQRGRALPQRDAGGTIVRWHGITDDIHELRVAEARLRESEQRFRQLAERLPQLIWTCRPDGPCTYLSQQWLDYTGLPEAQQLGYGWLEQIHPADRAAALAAWESVVAGGADLHVEFRIRRHDGVYRWFDGRAVLVRDASGQPLTWVGTNTDIEEHKNNQEILLRNAEQLQRLSRQLVEAQETERRSIAYELHDQVGQSLTGLKLVLDSTQASSPQQLHSQLAEARRAINELLGRVRNLSLDLRPSMLDDLGLLPALRWLIERYQAQTGVQVRWWHQNIDQRFPALIETGVYRIVQEAFTNVARHAAVREVELRIMADDEQLLVQIDDEGRGFDVENARQSHKSIGLIGMRERIELLGGAFLIDSAPGDGTHLNISIPLPQGYSAAQSAST